MFYETDISAVQNNHSEIEIPGENEPYNVRNLQIFRRLRYSTVFNSRPADGKEQKQQPYKSEKERAETEKEYAQ